MFWYLITLFGNLFQVSFLKLYERVYVYSTNQIISALVEAKTYNTKNVQQETVYFHLVDLVKETFMKCHGHRLICFLTKVPTAYPLYKI